MHLSVFGILFGRRLTVLLGSVVLACTLPIACAAASRGIAPISLEAGFHLLYDLDFGQAHQVFSSWEQEHPNDPTGPASDAAGLLFSEFDRLGVLESQFYENDDAFAARKKLSPDPAVRDRFNAALDQAENIARPRLARDPKDRDALFAMTLVAGLRGDYAALIENRNLLSLHYTKEAGFWAGQVLAVDPNCYDAHLATGFTKYIVGSMALPVRWILRLGGIKGDKEAGIAELQLTAEHGRYLAPLARIMLAIAYVRDKDKPRARAILASLHDEFPRNALFVRELARLDAKP
jgi:hypothetical protein